MVYRALIGVPDLQVRCFAPIRTWCLPIISATATGPCIALPQVWRVATESRGTGEDSQQQGTKHYKHVLELGSTVI